MIKLINRISGGEMWVAEARLDEYLAAGHKLAAPPPDADAVQEKPAQKTRTARKRTPKSKKE